ncbi:uncharacterized protein LOC127848837 [Dreissena polymorpha]|uniref:uncharacterized protein LOC127848837 n=1 Tax=Dreissena polymorpha TaxID=45954 RepID=UPI002264E0C2|nr:uncharacterized protein LOC127848837 [Dreissena polymorpha]
MSNFYVSPEKLFGKNPAEWVLQPGCECSAAGVGFVHEVQKGPEVYAASAGAIPGLTPEETAILAGVLTGLATFLFLLIPILCCLCPLSGCCGAGKKKAAAAAASQRQSNMMRSEHEFWNGNSLGKGEKMDYENLYGVDMKLPRPWVDNSMNGSHFDKQDGEWEGIDVSRDEIDAGLRGGNGRMGGEELAEQSGIVTYASGEAMAGGSGSGGGAAYTSMDRGRSGGDEVITEYTTTRRVDMTIGGMSQEEAEGYYAQNFGGGHNNDMSKDNFMKIYYQYRDGLNRNGN